MNKKIKYIIGILFSTLVLFTSCGENEYLYDSVDPADIDSGTLLLSAPNQTISVNPLTESTTFTIGLSVWGKLPKTEITVALVIDSTSADLPAEAFVVNGTGADNNNGSVSIDLISSELVIGQIYKIYYSLGTPSDATYEVNVLAKTGVITLFNPGLLGPWVGTFTVTAASETKASWDEEWSATTVLDPSDPLHRILINTGGGGAIVATIDVDAETITIAGNGAQQTGDTYGYGPNAIYWGQYDGTYGTSGGDYTFTTADVVGTVDPDGTIVIDHFGLLMTGDYAGYVWDVFDLTFTKDSKKSTSINVIPSDKKPIKMN